MSMKKIRNLSPFFEPFNTFQPSFQGKFGSFLRLRRRLTQVQNIVNPFFPFKNLLSTRVSFFEAFNTFRIFSQLKSSTILKLRNRLTHLRKIVNPFPNLFKNSKPFNIFQTSCQGQTLETFKLFQSQFQNKVKIFDPIARFFPMFLPFCAILHILPVKCKSLQIFYEGKNTNFFKPLNPFQTFRITS